MKVTFKSLIAATAFMMVGASHAAITSVPAGGAYNGAVLTGSQTYSASNLMVGFANVVRKSTIGNVGPAEVTVTTKVNAVTNVVSYSSIASKSPLSSFDIDTGTSQLQAASGLGGLSITVTLPSISSLGDGFVNLSDLKVDLANKRVYATITGGNGVGTQTNVPLWDATTSLGSAVIAPPQSGNAVNNVQLSGLSFTATARDLIAKSLNLTQLGIAALSAVTDAGTIDTNVTVSAPVVACHVSVKTTQVRKTPVYDNQITVQNLSSNPATGWSVNWTYDDPTLTTNVKNTTLTQKAYKAYTAQPVASNTTLAAGASTTATFRTISLKQTAPVLHDITGSMAGQSCTVSAQ